MHNRPLGAVRCPRVETGWATLINGRNSMGCLSTPCMDSDGMIGPSPCAPATPVLYCASNHGYNRVLIIYPTYPGLRIFPPVHSGAGGGAIRVAGRDITIAAVATG